MKTLKLIVLTFCFAAVTSFASAQSNDNSLVGKATAAAHDCINAARQPGYSISAETETVSICFAGGFITKVTFYKSPVCHQEPCPKPPTTIVAEVVFGCDNEVMSVTCY